MPKIETTVVSLIWFGAKRLHGREIGDLQVAVDRGRAAGLVQLQ